MASVDPKQSKQLSLHDKLKRDVDEQLSFVFIDSKQTHFKTYDQVIEKLTAFLEHRSEKVPSVNFKTVDQLLDWLCEHDMISVLLNEFGSKSRSIRKIIKDPSIRKIILRPLISFLFNIMDIDNNKCVTSDELLAYLAINLCDHSNLRNELIFRKLDKNGDNQLNKEEFEKFFILHFKMFCFCIIMDDLLYAQPLKNDDNNLDVFYTNNKKTYFRQDIDSVMTEFEQNCNSKMMKVQKIAEECFTTVDIDHDGFITLGELQKQFTDGFFSTRKKFIKKVNRLIISDMFHYYMDQKEIKYQSKKRALFPSFSMGVSSDELVKKHTPNFENFH